MSYELSPINTVLLPWFQPYCDQYGLVTDYADGNPSGNGLLYTSHYAVGLVENKIMNQNEQNRIFNVFDSCQRLPGLFMRNPIGQTNYESYDDLLGIMGCEAKMVPDKRDRRFTKGMYNYGKNINADKLDDTQTNPSKQTLNKWLFKALNLLPFKNNWVFNSQNPGTFDASAWLGHRREVVATMAMASNESVSPFDWLYWAVSIMTISAKSSNNAYILGMHSCWAVEGYGPMTDWVVQKMQAKTKAQYGDFGKLLGTYYQDPNQPLIKLLANVLE